MKTYPVALVLFQCDTVGMFLRSYKRKKNGKLHAYFSVVENRRLSGDKTIKRIVLYLGEITSSQENTWRKTIEVFDEDSSRSGQKMLFTDCAVITESQLDSMQVRLSQMKLCRLRSFGNCWLACLPWKQLGLDEFWQERIDELRGDVAWSKVIKLFAVNYLIPFVVETNPAGAIASHVFTPYLSAGAQNRTVMGA